MTADKQTLTSGRVLVVDDDATQRLLTQRFLQPAGFHVQLAVDGTEALECFKERIPDLVLLDVRMPGLDGFEVCTQIRAMEGGAEIPIIMVTGLEDLESIEQAYIAGATDFITKPVLWETLSHRVRYLMRAGSAIRDLRSSEERLLRAQRVARLANWEYDVERDRLSWSDGVYSLFPFSPDFSGHSLEEFLQLVALDEREKVRSAMHDAIASGAPLRVEWAHVDRQGVEVTAEAQAIVIMGVNGVAERLIGTIQDISERKRTEERIHQLAYYDGLTQLPNRELFRQRVDRAIQAAGRSGNKLALFFLDLDHFKNINDTLGHEAGDELLRSVAARLQHGIRASDVLAKFDTKALREASLSRLGGDEFTVLLSPADESATIARIAQRLLNDLEEPVTIQGSEYTVTGSIGVAIYPEDGDTVDALLKSADIAMYQAKQNGRNSYCFYATHMERRVQQRLRMESKLKHAIANNGLHLAYQPKVHLSTGELLGVEALLRWEDDELGNVPPEEFVALAEESDLILPLGDWVLEAACAQAQQWCDQGISCIRIAVNISSRQVKDGNLVQSVEHALATSHLDAGRLELELTETVLMDNAQASLELMQQLKSLGVSLSIDDFGTGYSSMAYLMRFPLDTIKIDQTFVQDIETSGNGSVIVKAIIALAEELGLHTIAEGVETPEQLEYLRLNHCDEAQGFLLYPPLSADAMGEVLRKHVQKSAAPPASQTQ